MITVPDTVEQLPEEVQGLARRVSGLRQQNVNLVQQLTDLGAGIEPGIARIEHLVVFLVEAGILTQQQRWEEAESWELNFRAQLKEAIENIKQFRADMEAEAEKQRRVQTLLGGRQL